MCQLIIDVKAEKIMKIGFHASHEQFTPGDLLNLTVAAEAAGFQAAMCSDHFHPWNELQGQSGFAWSWLGAALQATRLSFGVVCAPGQRYHPAIIAQSAATLAQMFPERFWIATGSGQLLNEGITGERWPPKEDRNRRLRESVDIMRRLWDGQIVTLDGYNRVEEAKLYTRPAKPPLIIGAAITPGTARWLGGWADGLITVSKPREELRQVVEAFHGGCGKGKPMFLKVQLSYAPTDKEALHGAWEQWRTNIFDSLLLSDLRSPRQFESAAQFVTPEEMHRHVRISGDPQRHIEWLSKDIELGFDHIYLHNVNRNQKRFIEDFGERVLPALKA
jgi:coenzyme F420-dependent glucose-6-phosphate dehydrogenase